MSNGNVVKSSANTRPSPEKLESLEQYLGWFRTRVESAVRNDPHYSKLESSMLNTHTVSARAREEGQLHIRRTVDTTVGEYTERTSANFDPVTGIWQLTQWTHSGVTSNNRASWNIETDMYVMPTLAGMRVVGSTKSSTKPEAEPYDEAKLTDQAIEYVNSMANEFPYAGE